MPHHPLPQPEKPSPLAAAHLAPRRAPDAQQQHPRRTAAARSKKNHASITLFADDEDLGSGRPGPLGGGLGGVIVHGEDVGRRLGGGAGEV